MTEAEWLTSIYPMRMLVYLDVDPDSPDALCFLVSCCRRVWESLPEECQRWVALAERVVTGQADLATFRDVELFERVNDSLLTLSQRGGSGKLGGRLYAVQNVVAADWYHEWPAAADDEWQDERAAQAVLVRDIFGNPFRPVSLDPTCRTPAVAALVTAGYENRVLPAGHLDPDRLAILADALEDAGCDNRDILSHLRGPGPHVRGCHVVDLLLGKE